MRDFVGLEGMVDGTAYATDPEQSMEEFNVFDAVWEDYCPSISFLGVVGFVEAVGNPSSSRPQLSDCEASIRETICGNEM